MQVMYRAEARRITLPALFLQVGQDRSIVADAAAEAFRQLGSADKTWKFYPDYAHDSEFEPDRRALDDDIAAWIKARTESARS